MSLLKCISLLKGMFRLKGVSRLKCLACALAAIVASGGLLHAGQQKTTQARVVPASVTTGSASPVAAPGAIPKHAILAHAIALTRRANGASLALELSGDVDFRLITMAGPDRIIIDLPKVAFLPERPAAGKRNARKRTAGNRTASKRASLRRAGPVSAFRYGLFIANQSRIVLDLSEPALLERVDKAQADGRTRIIFHFARADRTKFTEAAQRDAARDAAAASPPPPPPPVVADAKPLVVIDPGHGGIDGGAVTRDGDVEKTIVLALSLAVKDALEASGKVRVAMTREEDVFVSLDNRVRFARDRKAALMVSIHADKLVAERGVRGASIYTVSEKASDDISARLAASENAADQAAGVEAGETPDAIGDILFDLTKRETRQVSVGLARQLADALPEITSMHKNPLRSAGFRVLTAPDVPSVLIESGYLSSDADIRLLRSAQWRARMAGAIAATIEKFLGQNATATINSAARP